MAPKKNATHVLVKWTLEEKWDVYPIRYMLNTKVGFKLSTKPSAIDDLRGSVQLFKWSDDKPPAPAELLDAGLPRKLEEKRTKLVAAAKATCAAATCDEFMEGPPSPVASSSGSTSPSKLCSKCAALEEEVEKLKERIEELENMHEASKLLKRAKKIVLGLEAGQPHVRACPKVDIGSGVLVEEPTLVALKECCPGAPAKFARGLLRQLFTKEELRGKSLYGRKSNAHPGCAQREGLDSVKVKAIVAYASTEYKVDPIRLKASLSSLLSREVK